MANNFYIHIVESPSPDELLDGITEGRVLCEFLDIAEIPYSYNLALDWDQFEIAMTDRVEKAIYTFDKIPILHLSTHGSEQGIQLTDQSRTNDLIPWPELAEYLLDIHEYIGGLGVCMSCCGGAHGIQMAEVIEKEDIPYQWIAGSFSDIDLRDAALAYTILYRRLHRGVDDICLLIQAIRVASGISDFNIWRSERIQEAYRQERIAEIIERIRQRQRQKHIAQILGRSRRRHRGMP